MMKTRMIISFLLVLSGAVFLCSQEVVEEIVAIVNDDIITLSEYKAEYETRYQGLRAEYQGEEFQKQLEVLKKTLLDQMITERLLLQEAGKMDLNIDERVKLYIENLKENNNISSDEELFQIMRQQGHDPEEWKNTLKETALKEGVIYSEVYGGIVLDDSEMVTYHKLHPEEFTEPPEYKLKAIYLSSGGNSDEGIEVRKKEISEKIASGEDFAALASEYSEGPEKETQGDLGSFKKGELERSLEQEVEKLKEGDVTPWLKVRDGWYLLRLEKKKESRLRPFEEARKDIEQKLFSEKGQKKLEEYLKSLKERSYIKILKPNPLDFN